MLKKICAGILGVLVCNLVAIGGLEFQLGPVLLENLTQDYGIFRISPSFGAAAYDANQDGWPDVLISNHGKTPIVYLNRQGKSFVEAPELLPLRALDRHTPILADYDNDGDQDLYFLRGAHDGTGEGANEFLINPGHGKPFILTENQLLADSKGRGRTGVWFDYNLDGFVDLFVLNKLRKDAPNRLFRNNGDGTFTDVSLESGLYLALNSEGGATAGDIDNDGDMDLFLANTDERPYLFMNQGDGTFKDETQSRGVPLTPTTWSLGLADYNDDGSLDVYISRGVDGAVAEGAVIASHRLNYMQLVKPAEDTVDYLSFTADSNAVLSFQFSVKNVDRNNLYVGAKGVNPGSLEFKVGPGYLSADGRPPQYKADGSQRGTFIWRDTATGAWTIAAAAGNDFLKSGGLIETDSELSGLDISGMEPSTPQFPNLLLQNDGNGSFRNVTRETGTGDPSNSRSPIWVDLDNDGDLELFIVNAGFNGPGKQPHTCYINENGTFREYHLEMGPIERFGRGDGGLIADFNKDGFQDLFVVNGSGLLPANRGPYQLFINRTENSNRWISFRLIGAGKGYTNRDAIGAKMEVHPVEIPGKSYWRFILGGSGSYCQSTRTLHFGIADSEKITATVYWPPSNRRPNGHHESFIFSRSQLNRRYMIDELNGLVSPQ